jgi:hypothetical protein
MIDNIHLVAYLIIILLLVFIIFKINQIDDHTEELCVQRNYGIITDVPASNYADANMALIQDSSLGQKPLGDPRYWLKNRSPITQGQYGLYIPETLPLSETQPFDRSSLMPAAEAMPVYTDKPLPDQCTPLN